MTLTDSISQFTRSRTVTGTRSTYQAALNRFAVFLEDKYGRVIQVTELGENDSLDFAIDLLDKQASKFTVATYVAGIIEYLNDAMNRDLLKPGFSVEKAKFRVKDQRRTGSYPIHEPQPIERVIAFYENAHLPEPNGKKQNELDRLEILRGRALVWFLYATACRIGEARSMDRKHVQDGRATEIILRHAKGDKDRYLFLPDIERESGSEVDIYTKARDAISAYVTERKDVYEPLFISHKKGKGNRLSKKSIAEIVIGASDTLGLHITPHDFRHARAVQLINAAAPLEVIQAILGHADIGTTKRVYAHYKKETITNAVRMYAPQSPVLNSVAHL